MKIAKDAVVTMHYELTDPDGQVLDSSRGREPLIYLHGHGNLIPGLESRLEGWTAPHTEAVKVPASEGYGEHDPDKTIPAQRSQFPAEADLAPGVQFQANGPQGPMVVRIAEVDGDHITLDANHPLAGVDLKFAIELVGVRAATDDEISHGHVHPDGGCGHW